MRRLSKTLSVGLLLVVVGFFAFALMGTGAFQYYEILTNSAGLQNWLASILVIIPVVLAAFIIGYVARWVMDLFRAASKRGPGRPPKS